MYSDRGSVLHHKPKIENVMLHKQALNLLNTPRIVWKEMQAKQREINVGSPKKNPAGRMDDKYGERMRCWFTSFVVPVRVYDSDRSVKDGTKSEEPPETMKTASWVLNCGGAPIAEEVVPNICHIIFDCTKLAATK